MINWNTIPMVYNDSFTYMEWLGKLTYIADNHETRIDGCEKDIIDLATKINNHETRIVDLENWRSNTVNPFIVDMTIWKNGTVDPFIENTNKRMTDMEADIAQTKKDLVSEVSERRNADDAINKKLREVETVANQANTKVNRIDLDLQNIGKIRYFIDTATVSQADGNTSLSVVLPDEDWATIDVRFGITINSKIQEFRLSYVKSAETTQIQLTQNGIDFSLKYEASTRTITATAMGTTIAAASIYRFDYILYKGALTQAAQDQADVDFYNSMDANGDGVVNSSDASDILGYYADVLAGKIPEGLSGKEAWTWYCQNVKRYLNPDAFPDFDGDGIVNSSDASSILSYYAYSATHSESGLTGPQLMKQYRTKNGKA